ncbi:hypothetical protein OAJ93_01775 [Gammaproteobacteria bacterium]|nr:hypothetical protein [Gammaproteobacteria bacterium]
MSKLTALSVKRASTGRHGDGGGAIFGCLRHGVPKVGSSHSNQQKTS